MLYVLLHSMTRKLQLIVFVLAVVVDNLRMNCMLFSSAQLTAASGVGPGLLGSSSGVVILTLIYVTHSISIIGLVSPKVMCVVVGNT